MWMGREGGGEGERREGEGGKWGGALFGSGKSKTTEIESLRTSYCRECLEGSIAHCREREGQLSEKG